MRKHLIFCFVLLSFCIEAQQQTGQIVISAGVGYSPEFNGQLTLISSQVYPVSINSAISDYDNGFLCSSILPNIGGTIDFGISSRISLGLAGSYQNELVTYRFSSTYSDKVSRTNGAARFLYHVNKNNKNVDDYIGVRIGCSYWRDSPSPDNTIYNPYVSSHYYTITFLSSPSLYVSSFQFLYGIRLYVSDNIALYFEAGIGSPYLVETGLTFRINAGKASSATEPVNISNYGGHSIK